MRKRKHEFAQGLAITLVVFAVLIAGAASLFTQVSSVSGEAQTELVEDAVRRAAVTCYAVEGAYPAGIEYLMRHYGLVYDEESYLVIYDAFASNIMPDIRVIERGASL